MEIKVREVNVVLKRNHGFKKLSRELLDKAEER